MSDIQFACVFPGQGSQSVGMLKDLAETHSVVAETFGEASDALGFNLWDLVRNGPAEALNQTENTQPAMLAAGVSVWRAWKAEGGADPVCMAGHSLGEYSALVCAGALGFADAVALVAERGRLMQQAVPEGQGAMAAILGLEDDKIRALCQQAASGEVVEAVNFNSPGQVVVAGAKGAVERLIDLAKEAGAKRALALPVSVPSHCALMKPAAETLAMRLEGVQIAMPSIPVIHNVNVAEAADVAQLRQLLAQQLHSPVRWVETVQAMAQRGVSLVAELGPGKVLTGLNKRIDKNINSVAVFDAAGINTLREAITHGGQFDAGK